MKKHLLLIVALMATIGLRAQAVSDTAKVVLQEPVDLYQTVAEINNDLRLHAQLSYASFAFEGVGALMFYLSTNDKNTDKQRRSYETYGAILCGAGGVLFIASYLPIWRKELKVDERGLVVSIPLSK